MSITSDHIVNQSLIINLDEYELKINSKWDGVNFKCYSDNIDLPAFHFNGVDGSATTIAFSLVSSQTLTSLTVSGTNTLNSLDCSNINVSSLVNCSDASIISELVSPIANIGTVTVAHYEGEVGTINNAIASITAVLNYSEINTVSVGTLIDVAFSGTIYSVGCGTLQNINYIKTKQINWDSNQIVFDTDSDKIEWNLKDASTSAIIIDNFQEGINYDYNPKGVISGNQPGQVQAVYSGPGGAPEMTEVAHLDQVIINTREEWDPSPDSKIIPYGDGLYIIYFYLNFGSPPFQPQDYLRYEIVKLPSTVIYYHEEPIAYTTTTQGFTYKSSSVISYLEFGNEYIAKIGVGSATPSTSRGYLLGTHDLRVVFCRLG